MELWVDGYRSPAWKSNSLVRNLGPYYGGNLLGILQITIFPSYASTMIVLHKRRNRRGTTRLVTFIYVLHEGKRAKSAVSREARSYSHRRREIFDYSVYIFFPHWEKSLRKKFSSCNKILWKRRRKIIGNSPFPCHLSLRLEETELHNRRKSTDEASKNKNLPRIFQKVEEEKETRKNPLENYPLRQNPLSRQPTFTQVRTTKARRLVQTRK